MTNGRIRKWPAFFALSINLFMLSLLPGMPSANEKFSDQQELRPHKLTDNLPSRSYSGFEEKLSKGKFLVSSRHQGDPRFSETVILLIDYDWFGAVGLVINRPTDVKLSKVFPEIDGLQLRTDTVFFGGPVEKGQMRLLIRSGRQPEGAFLIFDNVYVSSSMEIFQRMIDAPTKGDRFRVYAGYAGWAPGQLERELLSGGWHVLKADPETVFDKTPLKIWPELIQRSSVLWTKMQ